MQPSSSYHSHPQWRFMLAAIRSQPDDDTVRLVVADWLDELETYEASQRAELIRVQVSAWRHPSRLLNPDATYGEYEGLRQREYELLEWFCREDMAGHFGLPNHEGIHPSLHGIVCPSHGCEFTFDRGFVTRVSAPLGVLHGGGECRRCGASGADPSGDGAWNVGPCSTCHGTARTPGVLAELLRREPLDAAGIEVTDATPVMDSGLWFWGKLGNTSLTHAHWLPDAVWQMAYAVSKGKEPGRGDRYVAFTSEPAARLALGEALFHIHEPKIEVTT